MNFDNIDVELPSESDDKPTKPQTLFQQINLEDDFAYHLKKSGFGKPTSVQEQALPILISGQDTILVSRTGSGKTLAFLIPLVHRLGQHAGVAGVRALIISPTRELSFQTFVVLKRLVKFQRQELRVALLTGGESIEQQFQSLATNPDVVVATPGRLLFIASQVANFASQLKSVQYLVADECDQMFEQQLLQQVTDVLQLLTKPQIVMCTATLPKQLSDFSAAAMKCPKLVQNESETFPKELFIQNVLVGSQYKEAALLELLGKLGNLKTLVFVATKYHCEYLQELLTQMDVKCGAIYGALDQGTRNIILADFKLGTFNILLATDVAARGVDIQDLTTVINFSFPFSPRMYLHRGGRCARNGQYGIYINLIDLSELSYLLDANIYVGQEIQVPNIDNYLKFEKVSQYFTPVYADDFIDSNKKLLKEVINKLFDDKKGDKEALETAYKECSAILKSSTYQQYQDYKHISTYLSNCKQLKLAPYSYKSFLNQAACRGKLNNQLGIIPQAMLDFKTQNLLRAKISTDYSSLRNSMQNSAQQLNKQKKSASDASADRARQLNLTLKESKHYAINYFQQACYEGSSTDLQRHLEVIQNFKVPTEQLIQKAEAGSKECQAALKLRTFIENKRELNRLSQLEDVKEITTLTHNNQETLLRMDEEIKATKASAVQELVPRRPTNLIRNIQLEVQQDELANVRGQAQKKVWDPVKRRYVAQQSMEKKKEQMVKKVQNAQGEWVPVKEKNLYQKWVQKSQQPVRAAGAEDQIDQGQARQTLRLQGLGRTQRRIIKEAMGADLRTSSSDKHNLQMQLDEKKVTKPRDSKSVIVQKKAEELRKKGIEWKDVKKRGRENSKAARSPYRSKSATGGKPQHGSGKPQHGGKKFGKK